MGRSAATQTAVFSRFAAPTLLQTNRFCGTFLDKNEVSTRVIDVVKNFEKVDAAAVTADSFFQKDLGLDSLDAVELVMAFEEEFDVEIPDNEADQITSCAEAAQYISTHP